MSGFYQLVDKLVDFILCADVYSAGWFIKYDELGISRPTLYAKLKKYGL